MQGTKYSRTEKTYNGKTVYGIEISVGGDTVYRYDFISVYSDQADELIERMARNDISPVHFNDIVCDYLESLYSKVLAVNGLN